MRKGDKILVEITDLGMDGEGVAKIDGIPVFIPRAVDGDLVKARITRVRSDCMFGEVLKVVRLSEYRVEPKCPYFGECGGCDIQHISRGRQAVFKKNRVENCFRKQGITCAVGDTVCGGAYEYRNKLQMPIAEIDGKIAVGFFRKKSHDVVKIDRCPLHGAWAEKLIGIFCDWANDSAREKPLTVYNETTGKGLLRHIVARFVGGFLSLTVVINGNALPDADKLAAMLKTEFEFNLYVGVNGKNTNVVMDGGVKLIRGENKVLNIDGIEQTLSPMSFLQVNDEIRTLIYNKAVDALRGSDIVFDVYSGSGMLSALIAENLKSKYAPSVYGIEIVKEATRDANVLAVKNGVANKVKNINGDAAIVMPILAEKIFNKYNSDDKQPNLAAIVDPPRKGCDGAVLDSIVKSGVQNIVYISCNPATLARDVRYLAPYYEASEATPFDMFPQTSHVETLVVLAKKRDKSYRAGTRLSLKNTENTAD